MGTIRKVEPYVKEWTRLGADWLDFLGAIAGLSRRVDPTQDTRTDKEARLRLCLKRRHMGVFEHWQTDVGTNLRHEIAILESTLDAKAKWEEVSKLAEPEDEQSEIQKEDRYRTFYFRCTRGCSHQLVRYRTEITYLQESTRYVDYSKDEYPYEYILTKRAGLSLRQAAVENAYRAYVSQRAAEIPVEVAREVLPTATATRIVATAPEHKWRYIIGQRAHGNTGKSSPEISGLMSQVESIIGK